VAAAHAAAQRSGEAFLTRRRITAAYQERACRPLLFSLGDLTSKTDMQLYNLTKFGASLRNFHTNIKNTCCQHWKTEL